MVFGNPTLFVLLLARGLDLFVDATFAMTPHPFYQVLIIMVHDCQTDLYVPVLYALMTHKCEDLYWRVLSEVIALSNWRLNVRNYTSDFELAIMNACRSQFTDKDDPSVGIHIGCYFHWKQAIRKYMISKLGFDKETVSRFMKDIDILTLIPYEDIETFGIPYLRSLYEGGIRDSGELDNDIWIPFYKYFVRQWLQIVPPSSWSVYHASAEVKEFINRTNNPLESYNKRLVALTLLIIPRNSMTNLPSI